MEAVSKSIKDTPTWSPIINCKDMNGNPIKAGYDLGEFKTGDQLQTYAVSPKVLAPAANAVIGAQLLSSDDMQLKNQMWSPTPGTSVLKSSNPTRAKFHATQSKGNNRFKWTVPYQTWTDGIEIPKKELVDGPKLRINYYNIYNRTGYVAYELFNDRGKSMGKRQDLGSLSSIANIMGIPIPYFPVTKEIDMQSASSVKLYFGSLGGGHWDHVTWDELNVSYRGALLTGAWQYGVPITFMIAGKMITSTDTFNKIVNTEGFVKEAIAVLSAFGFVLSETLLANKMYELFVGFSNVVISFGVQKGMEEFGKWLVEEVGKSQLSKVFGPIGYLFQLAALGLSIEQMAITTGEVLASDGLLVAEIKRAIDVSLTLHPSPSHGESGDKSTAVWPSVATNYVATLQCQGGTNFEIRGTLPKTTDDKPIKIAFEDVPAGGNFRVIIGLYSANGWLAGYWQNDWTPAVPDEGTTVRDLKDQYITECLVPLSPSTQYEYKEKITFSGGAFSWVADGIAPSATLRSLNCDDQGALCELSALTMNNSAFQVGMAWRCPTALTPRLHRRASERQTVVRRAKPFCAGRPQQAAQNHTDRLHAEAGHSLCTFHQ